MRGEGGEGGEEGEEGEVGDVAKGAEWGFSCFHAFLEGVARLRLRSAA